MIPLFTDSIDFFSGIHKRQIKGCVLAVGFDARGGMARPVRVDVEGGWYHVTARGIERRAIFEDGRDHEHFLERKIRDIQSEWKIDTFPINR